MLGHIFIFYPLALHPPSPTPGQFFLRWSHTCFILCFQCIHCARVVPFYSKLFNSLFFNLFFSPPNRSKMLFSNRVVVGKKKIQMFFLVFFLVFWCFKMCCCFKRIQDIAFSAHNNNTTLKRSQFLLDWLILCAKPFGQECALWICWYE